MRRLRTKPCDIPTQRLPQSWTCIFESAQKGGFWSIFSVFYMWDYISYPKCILFGRTVFLLTFSPFGDKSCPPAEMESHSYNGDWSLLSQVGRIPHCLCSPVLFTCPGSLVPSSTWSIQYYWRFWSLQTIFWKSSEDLKYLCDIPQGCC